MTDLLSRRARLQIDSMLIECGYGGVGLDIEFDVMRTATPEANSARVAIYNLSADRRKALLEAARKKAPAVRLEAGYADAMCVIFSGDFDLVNVTRRGPDVITEMTLRDGAKTVATAALTKAYRAGAQLSTVLEDLANATTFGLGNLADVVAEAQIEGVGKTFRAPVAINGNAYLALVRLCASAGLEVSIQGKTLQFTAIGGALKRKAVLLTPDSGLIGSPTVASVKPTPLPGQPLTAPDGKKGTVLKARSLIQPNLDPGQQVHVTAEGVDGAFTIRRVRYSGETSGTDWYADIEAVPVV